MNNLKVLKKTSPDELIRVFLLRHDFYSSDKTSWPIIGFLQFNKNELPSCSVYSRLLAKYWKGREEVGIYKSIWEQNEILLKKIWPKETSAKENETSEPEVMKKLEEAIADESNMTESFSVNLPDTAPTSVLIETEDFNLDFPVGVTYELQIYVAANEEGAKPDSSSIIRLYVRNMKIIPDSLSNVVRPRNKITKNFTLPNGSIILEVEMEKDVFQTGEKMEISLKVKNDSKKTVKFVRCELMQFIFILKSNSHIVQSVTQIESSEKCPLTPGTEMSHICELLIGGEFKRKRGLALEGASKDKDVTLCSSTLTDVNKSTIVKPNPGIKVSYALKISLSCGAIGGELTTELPFFLLPSIPTIPEDPSQANILIEQFSKFRRDKSIDNI